MSADTLALYKEELLALAEEIASGIDTPDDEFERGDNAGLFHAAALIRSKAAELL